MKVLLTGDTGYIGTRMKEILRNARHEVWGMDTDFFYWCTMGVLVSDPHRKVRDIRKLEAEDLTGFDAVIHLAALSNDPMGDLDEVVTQEINCDAAVELAMLAKNAGVSRFIFASSCSVYGDGGGLDYCSEESPINPLTAYARSKVDAETRISLLSDSRFAPTFMRNATVYGASPRFRSDLIVNSMTVSAYTTHKINVYGDGSLWRPVVHVADLCEAFLGVLESPLEIINNEIINVGMTEDNYTVAEVAKLVQSQIPDAEIVYVPQNTKDGRSYRVDFSKLFRLLPSYVTTFDVESGVRELVELFKDYEALIETNLTYETLSGTKYTRLKKLHELISIGKLNHALYWE